MASSSDPSCCHPEWSRAACSRLDGAALEGENNRRDVISDLTRSLCQSYKLVVEMAAPSFDSTRAVQFDLPRGSVRARGNGDPLLLVPSAALAELALSAPPEAVDALGRALGSALGRGAAARVGEPRPASREEFITQPPGEGALAG